MKQSLKKTMKMQMKSPTDGSRLTLEIRALKMADTDWDGILRIRYALRKEKVDKEAAQKPEKKKETTTTKAYLIIVY